MTSAVRDQWAARSATGQVRAMMHAPHAAAKSQMSCRVQRIGWALVRKSRR